MPNPKYVPRDRAVRAEEFGTRLDIEWVPVPSDLKAASWHDASQWQHRISVGVRELYPRIDQPIHRATLAGQIGEAPSELKKMFEGKVIMRLEHLSRLRTALGPDLDFKLLRDRSLFRFQSQAQQIERLTAELTKLRAVRPPMR